MRKTKKEIIVRTDLSFEELLKKALNTPLPKKFKAIKTTADNPRKKGKK